MPFISVFIPAYKNVHFLERLMRSILEQTYVDYEVIITDDSPDESVKKLVNSYLLENDHWHYYRNEPSLGMPQNWNYGLSLCKGDWIKIMHDDDWFSSNTSLYSFAIAAKISNYGFIFSAYSNIFANGNSVEIVASNYRKKLLKKEPLSLLSDNVVGPPSVTMVRNSIHELYDERLKWRVDIDYYIRVLNMSGDFTFIPEPLINVGIGAEQVTNEVKYNKNIELPEALIILEKYGTQSLKNIVIYDSWWRFVRNLKITDLSMLAQYTFSKNSWPIIIQCIVKDVNQLPMNLRSIGIFSKVAMLFSFLKNYNRIDA
ncbi:MAG: hypothetical protein DI598_04000 [Pseudopedobacter saltans]|uniref:Glycosyltransferase 2-like domain-containing protein n=1 Tax=Pseudopedobacter saltans TaxID=151895 RepID=A0A2W5GZ69_9SPHI|nr:MAG: hypothetical protein DI598_04000 [Pseudopedobacter saltans]